MARKRSKHAARPKKGTSVVSTSPVEVQVLVRQRHRKGRAYRAKK